MTDIGRVRARLNGDFPVVELLGEVDSSNADAIGAELIRFVRSGARGLIVDLSGADYLDSSGIRILFDLGKKLQRRGQHLRLVVPPTSVVRRVLDIVGYEPLLPDLGSALDELRTIARDESPQA